MYIRNFWSWPLILVLGTEEDEREPGHQNLHVDEELVTAGRLETSRRLRDDNGVGLRALDLISFAVHQTMLEALLV